MSHYNGRIYSEVVNGVMIGISPDDVSIVLGVNSSDVKTLCMAKDKINKWAKYKPERIDTPKSITLEQRKNNNFGLSPEVTYAGFTAFINAVAAGTFKDGWIYDAVGANDWGRLDDFDGYRSDALPPFGTLKPYQGVLDNNSANYTRIPCLNPVFEVSADEDSGMLSIADFQGHADYKNWYFGILLYNSSRTIVATASKSMIQTTDWQVDFGHLTQSYAGTYRGIPFLASKAYPVGSSAYPSDCKIVGCGQSGVEISLRRIEEVFSTNHKCSYADSTSTSVNYTVKIINNSSRDHTFDSVYLQIATSVSGTSASTLVSFGKITVKAGETWTRTGKANSPNRNYKFARLMYTGIGTPAWIGFMENQDYMNTEI